jgi:flagellin-like protein
MQISRRRPRRGFNEDLSAVSPVIATVLLLAITVMLTSMVFIMFQSSFDNIEKSPPQASLSTRALDNGYHVVRFSHLDQHLDPDYLQFQIISPNGSCPYPSACDGMASDADVYGKIGSNVTFFDRDAGFTVSVGDYFVIDSRGLGSDTGEWKFRLFYGLTNSEVAEVLLPMIPEP